MDRPLTSRFAGARATRRIALAACLLLLAAPLAADEEDGRVAVLAAKAAEASPEGLAGIAQRSKLDIWIVAELLRAAGASERAVALAAAWDDPERDALEAHLRNTPAPKLGDEVLRRLKQAERAVEQRAFEHSAALLAALDITDETTFGIWLLRLRARTQDGLGEPDAARGLRLQACRAALANGWASYPAVSVRRVVRASDAAEDYATQRRALGLLEAAYRRRGDRYRAGRQLAHLGSLSALIRDYATAESCFAGARADFEAVGRSDLAAFCLSEHGVVADIRGRYASALRLQTEALAIIEARPDAKPGDRAEALDRLGVVRAHLGEPAEALRLHRLAISLHAEADQPVGVAGATLNEGSALVALGRHEEGNVALARAHEQFEALGHERGAAKALDERAESLLAQARHAEALRLLETALPKLEASGDVASVARTLGRTAHVHEAALRIEAARARRAEAIRRSASIGALDVAAVQRSHLVRMDMEAARRLAAKGMDVQARRALLAVVRDARQAVQATNETLTGLGVEAGAAARTLRSQAWEAGAAAAAVLQDPEAFFFFVEAGRAAGLRSAIGSASADDPWTSVPGLLREAWSEARAGEATAAAAYRRAAKSGELDPEREAARRLREARNAVRRAAEAILVHRTATSGARRAAPGIDDLRTTLRGDTFVAYANLQGRLHALVIEPARVRMIDLGDANRVASAIDALRETVRSRADDDQAGRDGGNLRHAARALDRLVGLPLGLEAGAGRLLVSPDGGLATAPLCLLDTFAGRVVVLVPSAATHLRLADIHGGVRGRGVLALGDPIYRSAGVHEGWDLPPLPSTRREVESVAAGDADVPLLGEDASEERLRLVHEAAPDHRWRAIHFACHGVVHRTVPHLSALVLTPSAQDDGYLTCADVSLLPMRSDFVVLSACDTGRGSLLKGEGLVGLSRAFMAYVTPTVIASLWKVDDAATLALMQELQRGWKRGLAPDAALIAAQATVREREGWGAPRYWAAWVIWGAPQQTK